MTNHPSPIAPMIYARVAGFTFLLYIVAGIASLVLASQTQLANVLTLLTSFCALVLGLMLYALTRQVQPIVALLAMMCRVLEAVGLETDTSAIYFAVGSTLFAWLMLRGRLIPAPLAWLGLIASILLVVILPLQLAGLFGGAMSWSSSLTLFVWLPMLVYEVVLALWLLIKGVALPTPNVAPSRADFVA